MATKVNVVVVDDLDGSQPAASVSFGLDGVEYEVDLSEDNSAALREALSPYVQVARTVEAGSGAASARKPARRRRSSTSDNASETTLARRWAQENGIEVNSRGRLPQDILEMYRASLRD